MYTAVYQLSHSNLRRHYLATADIKLNFVRVFYSYRSFIHSFTYSPQSSAISIHPSSAMPPRPFPFALRIGTDIVSQARLRDLITRPKAGHGTGTQLDAFLRRVFTEREQFVFWKRFAGFHVSNTQRLPLVVSHLAGR